MHCSWEQPGQGTSPCVHGAFMGPCHAATTNTGWPTKQTCTTLLSSAVTFASPDQQCHDPHSQSRASWCGCRSSNRRILQEYTAVRTNCGKHPAVMDTEACVRHTADQALGVAAVTLLTATTPINLVSAKHRFSCRYMMTPCPPHLVSQHELHECCYQWR